MVRNAQINEKKQIQRVEMCNIIKYFPGVLANDRVCFDVNQGEVHALLGENGAVQGFRPLVRDVGDDLEMAIALLTGAAHAASLLLDSNLRIWPTPSLLAKYEPELAQLRH